MSQNNKLAHHCTSGDLVLLGISRKHSNHWVSAGIILGNSVIYSIRTTRGYQAVRQDLNDFLEHQSKPISLFRYKDQHVLEETPKLLGSVRNHTETRPSWWRKLLFKEQPKFRRDNSIDVSKVIISHLGIIELPDLERIGEFVRLL
jgi:hypothetical protein